jgi:hypothetical protein
MYCSTCGARVPDGRTRCDTCGAPVSRPAGFGVPAVVHAAPGIPVATVTCPRCGFQGPTVSYFSQGGHVAGLLMLALLTLFPAMGAGGLLYYLLRHNHRSCARCGETLGKSEMLALQATSSGGSLPAAVAAEADLPEEAAGSRGWTVGAWVLFAFAAMMMMIGVAEGEFVAFFFGAMSATGGAGLLSAGRRAREERRRVLLSALQQPVLRLAGECGGRLTVTEVASSLNWPMRRAEKVLNSLEDGLRVQSDVTREGVIVYEFRELMHASAKRLDAEEMDLLLGAPAPHGGATQAPSQQVAAPRADATQAQQVAAPRMDATQAQQVAAPRADATQAQQVAAPRMDATQAQQVAVPRADATQAQPVAAPWADATQVQPVAPRTDATQAQPVAPRADATQAAPPPLPHDGTLRA